MTEQTQTPVAPAQHPPEPAYLAPAPMLESEARTWAMLTHMIGAVASFISQGTLSFIAPLVIWLLYKDRSALVGHHGRENLNLQLTSLLVFVVAMALGLVTIGIGLFVTLPLYYAYWLYALIISIIAGVRANAGEYYRIPFMIRFIK